MKQVLFSLVWTISLSCAVHADTNAPSQPTWDITHYLDPGRAIGWHPSGEVLAEVPKRMLQLRQGMTASEFWKTLGLDGCTVRGMHDPIRCWKPPRREWLSVGLGEDAQFEMQVMMDSHNTPHPCGIRIRQTNVLHWVECVLGELTEQQKAQRSARYQKEVRSDPEWRQLMDWVTVSSNAVIRSRPSGQQPKGSQQAESTVPSKAAPSASSDVR